jgi:GAF domain-containing protein
MSRKGDVREMASLVGNSAAHIAIYREGAEKEVGVYMEIASEIAEKRSWNEREIEDLKELAARRAASVINERIKRGDLSEKEFDLALKGAQSYINKFVDEELSKK